MKKELRIFLIIGLLLLDQSSKILIHNRFDVKYLNSDYFVVKNPDSEIRIIGDFLKFVYVENAGMAFGIQFGEYKILLSFFSIAASIFLISIVLKLEQEKVPIQIAFSLITAGAIGNLIDRVFYGIIFGYGKVFWGRVIDFVQVDIPDITIGSVNYTHFPVFNVADSCITIGVIILILFNKHIPNIKLIFFSPKKDSH
ncbi:MAG: signal peptidase II [Candidatus Kapaibacteriales bacterium]